MSGSIPKNAYSYKKSYTQLYLATDYVILNMLLKISLKHESLKIPTIATLPTAYLSYFYYDVIPIFIVELVIVLGKGRGTGIISTQRYI